ncbi:glycosyl hydrolase, family 31 [Necator americanus]|uniref:Glycosyl hydrolase, family 31 n=1 Tax=Necator americanus TaxID=51031 RepID=W2SZF8_NECAM|nr:glycosyl hydrolase, family 31 [Necator americanus]ETN75008.1 glycosyl hydrolase, family 31 [Necator americanus]
MREGIGYTLAETKGPLTILNKNDGPQNPWGEDIRKVHFETSRLGDILNEFTTAPGPALIYRTIGGNLDLYFFPGPSPENVIEQYQALIGRPIVPAYWAFGFQLSRYGYKDLEEMIEKVRRNIEVGVPIETTVCDIEYMDRYKDFTIGKGWEELPTYVEELHKKGMRAILIWDPAIQVDYDVFERALQLNARFIEWERKDQVMQCIQDLYPLVADTKIMLGVVWPDRHAAFPDFLDRNTRKWWIEEFIRMYNKVQFDGVWIDMNEPANFGTNEAKPWYFDNPDHPNISTLYCPLEGPDSSWDMPPYQTHNNSFLAQKTLCMLALQANGTQRFYNVKGLFGLHQAEATLPALYAATSKRGVIVSRSTFASAGRYAGHWLGDNAAQWEDLQTSVIGVQEFNLFGIPNHNCKGAPPQDPAEWKSVAEAARKAILFRYKYLPYLYSLHFTVSVKGGTVIRPVFFEFPLDKETHNLGHQFMWGRSMMIVPVLKKALVDTLMDFCIGMTENL